MDVRGQRRVKMPLQQRWYDVGFIVAFSLMLCIALFFDIINLLSPVGKAGVPGITPESVKDNTWPPAIMYDLYFYWCKLADPLFCFNPVWMKFLAAISPLVYAPFYCFAIFAFYHGKEWIRIPALCYGWGLFTHLILILLEEYAGELPSHNFPICFVANSPYLFMPVLLLLRLHSAHPFTCSASEKRD